MKVNFYAPNYSMWAPFSPTSIMDRMCGGGEVYLINGAKALGEAGHKVKVYVPQGSGEFGNVTYCDAGQRVTDCDVLVNFETDRGTGQVESEYRLLACQCNDPEIHFRVDKCLVPSNWLGKHIHDYFHVLLEKMVIIPDATFWELYQEDVEKVPKRMIYCSSPDRGLHHLLRLFPLIKKKVPDAHLRIFYSFWPQFEANKWGMNMWSEMYWNIKKGFEQDGVEYVGPVGKRQLAKEQMSSVLLCFPEDTMRPTEGFGITYADMLAAKVAVMASDVDAVGELWGDYIALMPPPPIKDKEWAEMAVELLNNENERKRYWESGREKVAKDYTWQKVGERWVEMIASL